MDCRIKIIHPTVEYGNVTVEVIGDVKLSESSKVIKEVIQQCTEACNDLGLNSRPKQAERPKQAKSESTGGPKEHTGTVSSEVSLKKDSKGNPFATFLVEKNGKKFGVSIWQGATWIANNINEGDSVTIFGEIKKDGKYYKLFAGKLVSPAPLEHKADDNADDDDIPF